MVIFCVSLLLITSWIYSTTRNRDISVFNQIRHPPPGTLELIQKIMEARKSKICGVAGRLRRADGIDEV